MAVIDISFPFPGPRFPISGSVVNITTEPKRVTIKQVTSPFRSFTFPFGPREVQYQNIGLEYMTLERPMDVSLLERANMKSRTLQADFVIADGATNGLTSVEQMLSDLENISAEDADLVFSYGVRTLPYRVRITQLQYQSIHRDLSGNITQARVSITFTERPLYAPSIVSQQAIEYTPPTTPGNYSPSPSPPPPDEPPGPGWPPGDPNPLPPQSHPPGGGRLE